MTFLAGDTVLIVEQAADAPDDAAFDGKGWRYITFQVFEVDREHAYVLAHGGREARAPVTLGTTAQDFDGARSRRQLDRAVAARLADGLAGAVDGVSPPRSTENVYFRGNRRDDRSLRSSDASDTQRGRFPCIRSSQPRRYLAPLVVLATVASAGAGSGMYGTTAQIANAAGVAAIGAVFFAIDASGSARLALSAASALFALSIIACAAFLTWMRRVTG